MRAFKRTLQVLAAIVTLIVIVVLGYLVYGLFGFLRYPDGQTLPVRDGTQAELAVGTELKLLTWNLGYCADDAEADFFMDGGTASRARSEESVRTALSGIEALLAREDADCVLLQEVDYAADRSRFVDEVNDIAGALPKTDAVYAENYHSNFLFYPVSDPIGRIRSGLLTLSKADVTGSIRRSLPVGTGIDRVTDLDRCYSVSDIAVADGRTLKLYDVHLSAYTSDERVKAAQFEQLFADMAEARAAGCYVIAGGDFNACLIGEPSEAYTWSRAFPAEKLPEGFTLVASEQAATSCRNLDTAYVPGKTFTTTVDGFIVSDDVSVVEVSVLDEGFRYSDHNPVRMRIMLNETA